MMPSTVAMRVNTATQNVRFAILLASALAAVAARFCSSKVPAIASKVSTVCSLNAAVRACGVLLKSIVGSSGGSGNLEGQR